MIKVADIVTYVGRHKINVRHRYRVLEVISTFETLKLTLIALEQDVKSHDNVILMVDITEVSRVID